jgi:hypothetical protein
MRTSRAHAVAIRAAPYSAFRAWTYEIPERTYQELFRLGLLDEAHEPTGRLWRLSTKGRYVLDALNSKARP